MRDSFGAAPAPLTVQSIFLASQEIGDLKELNVGLGGGSLRISSDVERSFEDALHSFPNLTSLTIRGGVEGLGILTEPVALAVTSIVPTLDDLTALSLDIEAVQRTSARK